MTETKKIQMDERGFASIVVALVLIIVLALITVGFAQLARREQQSALNKQLANQAYYAAESGINDVVQGIKTGTVTPASLPAGSDKNCIPAAWLASHGFTQAVDSGHGVSYNCVMVDLLPPFLQYSLQPGNGQSAVFTPSPAPASPTINLNIQWGTGDATAAQTHDNFFPPGQPTNLDPAGVWNNAANNHAPLIELNITPFSSSGFDRSALINSTYTAYLWPSKKNNGPPLGGCPGNPNQTTCVQYDTTQQAPIIKAACNTGATPAACSVTVIGIPYNPGADTYLIRMSDFYDAASVYINGSSPTGTAFSFADAQDIVDVTGQSRNVLKRIRVFVPANQEGSQSNQPLPNAALKAGNICKHFQTDPIQPTNFLASNGSPALANTACKLE